MTFPLIGNENIELYGFVLLKQLHFLESWSSFKRIVVCNEGFLVDRGIKIFDLYVKECSILITRK